MNDQLPILCRPEQSAASERSSGIFGDIRPICLWIWRSFTTAKVSTYFLIFATSMLRADGLSPDIQRALDNARAQTQTTRLYDPAYVSLSYPGGDVPADRGVCTDVIVRALRGAGVDLQALVHEDMKKHFAEYPKLWGLSRTDPNIDHRRVPNLMKFFARQGKTLPVTQTAADYLPGDIVAWKLSNGLAHMGLVVDEPSPADPARRMVIHNIGGGAQMEDVLFAYEITGHARYFPAR
jgi:uncharacterized protein YijF (DUF1287 family)